MATQSPIPFGMMLSHGESLTPKASAGIRLGFNKEGSDLSP